ncbi:MAG TPA: hypothetical protein VGA90_11870 [Methylomirabilota bacterium]|jgi:hypothetical protein
MMNRLGLVLACAFMLTLLASGFALAADDSKVKAATEQVERGAKKIPDGKIGEGVGETAKGIGNTVTDDAKDGAVSFGHSVKGFFANLFSK